MSLEFLLVKCPVESAVLADGGNVGWTNRIMLLAPDSYRISLAVSGYTPDYYDITLGGTSAAMPCNLVFTAAAPSPATPPAAMAASAPAAAIKSKRKPGKTQ